MGEEKKHTRNSKVFANDGHNKKKKNNASPSWPNGQKSVIDRMNKLA